MMNSSRYKLFGLLIVSVLGTRGRFEALATASPSSAAHASPTVSPSSQPTITPTRANFFSIVSCMVENSPQYRAAKDAIAADISSAQPGRYAHFPELSGQISQSFAGTFESKEQQARSTTAGVSLSVPVYRFGADEALVEQSQRALRTADAALDAARVQSEKQMATLLIEWLKAEKQVGIEERVSRSRYSLLEKAEGLYKRGLLPDEELEKMRVEVGLAQVQLNEMKTNERSLRGQLEVASCEPVSPIAWAWSDRIFQKFETWNASAAIENFLSFALQDAQLAVQKAQGDVVVARAAGLPSINFAAGLNKSLAQTANESQSNPVGWSLGLTAAVPLFSRFENQSRLESALHQLSAAQWRLKEKERQIRNDISKIASMLANKVIAARERGQFLQRATANLARARERFLAGKISSNDLATDETRVSQMEQALTANTAALHQDVIDLCALFLKPLQQCETTVLPR